MKRYFLFLLILAVYSLESPTLSTPAQSQRGPAGRWEGSVDLQYLKLGIILNLAQRADGVWTGNITIPSQGIKDSVLANVVVKGSAVSFATREVTGDPVYQGRLSEDSRSITGELTQSDRTFAFKLERRTETESSARQTYGLTPERGLAGQGIDGVWQADLDAGGVILRVVLKVKKASDGSFAAHVDSPDQGVTDMLVDRIAVRDHSLQFEIKRIKASYAGTVSQDGSEISGQWDQNGIPLPLILRRLARH